jgi:hypothetical protein
MILYPGCGGLILELKKNRHSSKHNIMCQLIINNYKIDKVACLKH